MAVKSAVKSGSLVLLNPKTGEIALENDSDAAKDFSDESIDSDELDSEYASDHSGEASFDEAELRPLSEIWDMDDSQKQKKVDIVLDTRAEELEELSSSEEESSEEESGESSGDEADLEEDVFGSEIEEDDDAELNTVMQKLQLSKASEKQKRKLVSLSAPEGALSVPVSGEKLSIADMMAGKEAALLKESVAPMAVPLPKRLQERNERRAAYEISKKDVETWKDDVERLKRAEVVKFPLVGKKLGLQKTLVFLRTNPMSELEKKVGETLEVSLLEDTKKEALFEQIETARMSKEDMIARQNELRRMRELLFREEKRAKRIKKIKSKSYRRVKKKEMLRNQALVEELEGPADPQADDEARAEARMTLKFKNSSSKWARDMLKHGMTKDKETRAEMEAMLQRGQQLRERVLGEALESEGEIESGSSDDEAEKASVGKTGFMNMAFMKKAEAKKKEQNRKDLEELRAVEEGGDIEAFKDGSTSKVEVSLNKGRKVYSQEATRVGEELEQQNRDTVAQQEEEEEQNLGGRLEKEFTKKQKKQAQRNENQEEKVTELEKEDDESNPWLGGSVKRSSKMKVVDENSTYAEKKEHKLQKSKKTGSGPEEVTLIDTQATLKVRLQFDEDDDVDEDDVGDAVFEQQELIKEAFAGDDVVKEFEREKKRIRNEEDDQWISAEPPGFNSWVGGTETQKKKQRKSTKKKKVTGVKSADKRRDKNLKNVIFNERVNKKLAKYQASAVPFPYENREQYERSLQMPVGQEWNTRATFQRLTMPGVITKPGEIIRPLTKGGK